VLRFPEESQYASYHGSLTTAVSLLDVFPTIVDLALGPNVFHRSSPVRGRSLLDRLARNDWEEVLEAESSLFPMTTRECPEVAGYARAIVDGRYKLITVPRPYVRTSQALWPSDLPLDAAWTRKGPRPDYVPLRHPVELLYDLSTDPGERHNIAPGNSAIVKALLAKAGSDWACQRTVGQDAESNSAAWDKDASETLKALGYTE
jgi:arylsulfatase A-like enzyme